MNKVFLYKIDINSGKKIDNFIKIIKDNNIKGDFQDAKDSPKYIAKGDGTLGALSTMELEQVWYWCNQEIDELIKDFIIERVEV